MTYSIGGNIDAADFNTFADQINSITSNGNGNYGYGLSVIPTVQIGNDVSSSDWIALVQRIQIASVHQGIPVNLPNLLDLEVGDDILCYDGSNSRPNIPGGIDSTILNRLTLGLGQSNTQVGISSNRNTSWSNQLIHKTSIQFSDQDHARHFFNSGGEIRFSAERSGGSISSQNSDWSSLLSGVGNIVFNHINYFALTTTNTIFSNITSSHYAYADNDWTILVKTNNSIDPNGRGGKGNIITFEIQFNDDYTDPNVDVVDGTIVSTVNFKIASGSFSVPPPNFVNDISLTAGS